MTTTDRLRALLAEATPGPWTNESEGHCIGPANEEGGRSWSRIIWDASGELYPTVPDAALIVAAVNALPALLEFVAIAKRAVTMFHACDRHPGVWTTCDYGDCPAYRAALAKLDGEPNPR